MWQMSYIRAVVIMIVSGYLYLYTFGDYLKPLHRGPGKMNLQPHSWYVERERERDSREINNETCSSWSQGRNDKIDVLAVSHQVPSSNY